LWNQTAHKQVEASLHPRVLDAHPARFERAAATRRYHRQLLAHQIGNVPVIVA
jgi:hypothetical protein